MKKLLLPLALTVKDARTGRFILANRAAETLFDRVGGLAGLKPAEVLPSSLAEWTAAAMTRGRETAVHEDHGRGGVRYLEATKVATYVFGQPRETRPTGVLPPSPRNLRGLTTRPLSQTSKCTWAPVERPVEPALATSCPARTRSPTFTTRRELCA